MSYVGCRVDQETKEWLVQVCENAHISMAQLLVAMIEEFKKEQERKASENSPP